MRFFGARYLDLRCLQNLDSFSLYLIRELLPEIGPLVAIKHGKTEVPIRFHFAPKTSYQLLVMMTHAFLRVNPTKIQVHHFLTFSQWKLRFFVSIEAF
jgi:hypothetical protein